MEKESDELNEKQQEIVLRLGFLEQQIKNLQQQLQAIEDAIIDMSSLNLGLDEIKDGEGKEVLASIGRGIYIKTQLQSETLFVDVGEKTFVKKSVEETKNMIKEQIKKLENVKEQLSQGLQELDEKVNEAIGGGGEE